MHNLCVCHLFDPGIAYRYPMRVTSKVFNNLLGSRDWEFAVYDPFFGKQLLPYGLWNGDFFTEYAHKLSTEHNTHSLDREQKRTFLLRIGYIPPKSILVNPTTQLSVNVFS